MAFTIGAAATLTTEGGGGNAQSPSTAFTAGRQLVALVWWDHATVTLTGVNYDEGGANQTAFTAVTTQVVGGSSGTKMHIFYLSNVPITASKVIRCNWSGSLGGAGALRVVELIGGDTTDALDSSNTATASSAGPLSCSVSTNTNNCAIFAIAGSAISDPAASGAGYVEFTLNNFGLFEQGEYNLDVGSSGAKTVAMTHASSGQWGIKAAAFKLAAGAPTNWGRLLDMDLNRLVTTYGR